MNVFVELLQTLAIVIWSSLKAFIFCFVPAPQKSVEGEIVLITGAGSGLGRLMCLEFAKRGAVIVAWDVVKEGNEETAKLVKEHGGKIYTYSCDISNRDEVNKAATRVRQDVGDVTILVNNAGIVTGKRFIDCPDHMIQKTFEVNALAHFWTIKAFLPTMLQKNSGHLVCTASIAGVIGCTSLVDYSSSKFANVGLMESLALEFYSDGYDGLKTTTVCPYFINTGMFDGCHTRFPWLLPILDPKETVDTIMKAVLRNQEIVYIPRIMYFLAFLKSVMDIDSGRALHKFFGAVNFMDTFKGRQGGKSVQNGGKSVQNSGQTEANGHKKDS